MSRLCFIDFETLSDVDLGAAGAFRYIQDSSTKLACLAWAFDDGPVEAYSPLYAAPGSLDEVYEHNEDGGTFVASNSFFDRHVFARFVQSTEVRQWVCASVRALASNLPGSLDGYSRALGTAPKDKSGKLALKRLQTALAGFGAPSFVREAVEPVVDYCKQDVRATRAAWGRMLPLRVDDWTQFHVSEEINDRGVLVDLGLCEAAARRAEDARTEANLLLETEFGVRSTQHLRIAALLGRLTDGTDLAKVVRPEGKMSAAKSVRDALAPHASGRLSRLLDLVELSAGTAASKFRTLQSMATEGRLRGAFKFSGGGQTGRFASKGVQVHNLRRDPPKDPEGLIRTLRASPAEVNLDQLGSLVRCAFVAPPGSRLVSADWSSIEARVLPWLTYRNDANGLLEAFRRGEDVYIQTAAKILEKPPESVTKDERQKYGKVPVLALGFGGGAGAFAAMATGYGINFDPEVAQDITDRWRATNPWATGFWSTVEQSFEACFHAPRVWVHAGRCAFRFEPKLLGGTILARLPSGRMLTYPEIRAEQGNYGRLQFTYHSTKGGQVTRKRWWRGLGVENLTQATAADCLRELLVRLQVEPDVGHVVLHVHDQVVLEVPEGRAEAAAARLVEMMREAPSWADGLPLDAEATTSTRFGK